MLLFLYNSGARASEAVGVTVADLGLPATHPASVRLMGKGSKVRRCPLWASTAGALKTLIGERPAPAAVFVNRRGHPLTRYGVHDLVARYGASVAQRLPSPQQKRSARTRFVTRRRPISSALASTSTPFARGSGTCRSTRRTCTPRSISRVKRKRSRHARFSQTREDHPCGRITRTSWSFFAACRCSVMWCREPRNARVYAANDTRRHITATTTQIILCSRPHKMIYTHVVKELRNPARSPLDILRARAGR